jgi:hypothetical protein
VRVLSCQCGSSGGRLGVGLGVFGSIEPRREGRPSVRESTHRSRSAGRGFHQSSRPCSQVLGRDFGRPLRALTRGGRQIERRGRNRSSPPFKTARTRVWPHCCLSRLHFSKLISQPGGCPQWALAWACHTNSRPAPSSRAPRAHCGQLEGVGTGSSSLGPPRLPLAGALAAGGLRTQAQRHPPHRPGPRFSRGARVNRRSAGSWSVRVGASNWRDQWR